MKASIWGKAPKTKKGEVAPLAYHDVQKVLKMLLPKRSYLPVLHAVKARAWKDEEEQGWLDLSATNLDAFGTVTLPAQVEEEGEGVFIPWWPTFKAGQRLSILAGQENLPPAVWGKGATRHTSTSFPLDEFPKTPNLHLDSACTVSVAFLEQLARVVVVTAKNDSRPLLTTVHATLGNGQFELAATQGFSLMKATSNSHEGDAMKIKIQRNLVPMLTGAAGKGFEERIDVVSGPSHTRFHVGAWAFFAIQVDGNYPDVARLIPGDDQARLILDIDPTQMIEALAGVKEVAFGSSGIVFFSLDEGDDVLRLRAGDEFAHAESWLPVVTLRQKVALKNHEEETTNEEPDTPFFALNWTYLHDAMKASSGRVQLRIRSSSSPARVDGDGALTQVIMPMHVNPGKGVYGR